MTSHTPPVPLEQALRAAIREIRDFPVPGIRFKDITPVLADPRLFGACIEALRRAFGPARPTHVAAVESRGFLLGAPLALALDAALVPVRKVGKLPSTTHRIEYALEYGTSTLEVHRDACGAGARVLVVDDVLATGGTARATCELMEMLGAEVVGVGFLMSLDFLAGESHLGGRRVHALVRY